MFFHNGNWKQLYFTSAFYRKGLVIFHMSWNVSRTNKNVKEYCVMNQRVLIKSLLMPEFNVYYRALHIRNAVSSYIECPAQIWVCKTPLSAAAPNLVRCVLSPFQLVDLLNHSETQQKTWISTRTESSPMFTGLCGKQDFQLEGPCERTLLRDSCPIS